MFNALRVIVAIERGIGEGLPALGTDNYSKFPGSIAASANNVYIYFCNIPFGILSKYRKKIRTRG